MFDGVKSAIQSTSIQAPTGAVVEVAFSPDGESEALVLKVINSAKSSIRLAAYSFTLPSVTRALVSAKQRGVDVAVIVDYRNNITDDRSGKARQALNLLVNAGIPTRTISAFAIHHSKFLVSDGLSIQTGSLNYSQAAIKSNSENVLVIWNNPKLAAQYLKHWQNRYELGQDFHSSY